MLTTTVNFGWNNISETYRLKCEGCGKTLTRTVQTGYNNCASHEYRLEAWRKLVEDARRREKTEKETCTACLRSKIPKSPKSFSRVDPDDCLKIRLAHEAYRKLEGALAEQYKGRVCRWRDLVFVIDGVSYDSFRECVQFTLGKINKVRPWLLTDTREYVDATEVEVSTEIFKTRKEAVKAA